MTFCSNRQLEPIPNHTRNQGKPRWLTCLLIRMTTTKYFDLCWGEDGEAIRWHRANFCVCTCTWQDTHQVSSPTLPYQDSLTTLLRTTIKYSVWTSDSSGKEAWDHQIPGKQATSKLGVGGSNSDLHNAKYFPYYRALGKTLPVWTSSPWGEHILCHSREKWLGKGLANSMSSASPRKHLELLLCLSNITV